MGYTSHEPIQHASPAATLAAQPVRYASVPNHDFAFHFHFFPRPSGFFFAGKTFLLCDELFLVLLAGALQLKNKQIDHDRHNATSSRFIKRN